MSTAGRILIRMDDFSQDEEQELIEIETEEVLEEIVEVVEE